MTALWVACPAVEVERDTVDVSTEIKIFSLRSCPPATAKASRLFRMELREFRDRGSLEPSNN
jgi:hypothetical protein